MTVIDAHQHFWTHARRAHSWPPAAGTKLDRDFTPQDLLPEMRRAGVDGTVLIQSLNDGEETLEYLDLANGLDWVRGVVGWTPLDHAAETEVLIERLHARGKLVGFRHLLRFEAAPDWLQQPDVLASLGLIARAGLVFELVPVNPAQYAQMLAIAARLPDLRLIINHLGRPPVPEQGWEPWASFIREAATHPNLNIKLSTGVAMIVELALVDRGAAPLRRPCDRLLRPGPHPGGEQLAGDPHRRRVSGGLGRHHRPGVRPLGRGTRLDPRRHRGAGVSTYWLNCLSAVIIRESG